MTPVVVRVAEATMLATPEGALFRSAASTLVVADLHLEKGSAFARRGVLLLPYDSRATIARLASLIARLQPARVVCLGDSFHDRSGPARLAAEDRATLSALIHGREWIWVDGNHDGDAAACLGGDSCAAYQLGPLALRHQAAEAGAAEVCGHLHPKASVALAGRRHTGRCFAGDGRRLILPAFGAYAGGLDVFDPAIAGLLAASFTVHVLGRYRLHTLPSSRLSRPAMPLAPIADARPAGCDQKLRRSGCDPAC